MGTKLQPMSESELYAIECRVSSTNYGKQGDAYQLLMEVHRLRDKAELLVALRRAHKTGQPE